MTVARRAAGSLAACLLGVAGAAWPCEAVLREHRSGAELARVPMPSGAPQLQIAFEHSVLGTTVVDRYRFAPEPRLVEERFEGQGYGLPHAAGPGEALVRDGGGWRLTLDRPVQPLVVRALPQQRMRLLLPAGELLLASLTAGAVEIRAQGCGGPEAS